MNYASVHAEYDGSFAAGPAQTSVAFEPTSSWFHDIVRLKYAGDTGAFLGLGESLSTMRHRDRRHDHLVPVA